MRDVIEGNADSGALAATVGLIINPTDVIRLDVGLRYGIWGENVDPRVTGTVNVSITFGGRPR